MTETDRLNGLLEAYEQVYADLTERDLIASRPDENPHGVWRLDDGAETRSLDEVITAARALVHYALNLFRQKHGS